MRYVCLGLAIGCILFMGCSGKDSVGVDTIPPIKPHLISHLGDTGDGLVTTVEGDINMSLDNNGDELNGIDAVPDNDGIKITWSPLVDTDLELIRIYRFSDFDTVSKIDSISIGNAGYVDTPKDDNFIQSGIKYSYFIEVIDKAGNSTISDTVSYKLLDKQQLVYPASGAQLSTSSLHFSWMKNGSVMKFRVLLFDQNHHYQWHKDIYPTNDTEDYDVNYDGFLLANGTYYWRVDAFDFDEDMNIYYGSESLERTIYLR